MGTWKDAQNLYVFWVNHELFLLTLHFKDDFLYILPPVFYCVLLTFVSTTVKNQAMKYRRKHTKEFVLKMER